MIKEHYASTDPEFHGPWVDKIVNDGDLQDILLNLNAACTKSWEEKQVINITFSGPDETPYMGKEYALEFDIPDKYPEVPLECYIHDAVYHLNVL